MSLWYFLVNVIRPDALVTIHDALGNIFYEGKAEKVPSRYEKCEIVYIEGLGSRNDLLIEIE